MVVLYNPHGIWHQDVPTLSTIHVEFAKDRSKKELAEAPRGLAYFTDRAMATSYALLANEFAMTGYKTFFRQRGLHATRASEFAQTQHGRAFHSTWKCHFISVLCTTDSTYPFAQCNRLVPRINIHYVSIV
jgi:hypothetical protein